MAHVRLAEDRDLPQLAAVEDAADARFAAVFDTTGWLAADSGEERAAEPGLLVVAGDPVVGFAHVLDLDGHWHLEQIAVHPDAGRHGVGSALLAEVHAEVARRGGTEVTLTTYRDVPWNAPFYAARGYVVVEDLAPFLAAIREHERALDLERNGPRVAMVHRLR
ncbi:MAG TPA: GNAT family N-acetyltransferase [Dermatophilaceae bacterium]|nr:GNAT family N-acetyltransferase [Dermatophilaceae bacterium]